MDFGIGQAVKEMKLGNRVARRGWNGKDMWLTLSGLEGPRVLPAVAFWSANARQFAETREGKVATVLPCILMKTATDEILMGWLASQTDLLAEDWFVVDPADGGADAA